MHRIFRLSLTVILLILFDDAMAQKYKLSPANVDESGMGYIKVLGQDNDGFFVLQSNLSFETNRDRIGFRNRKYRLSYFDFDLKQKWSKPVSPSPDNTSIETVGIFNNKPFIITSLTNKADNTITLFVTVTDNKGNNIYSGKKISKQQLTHVSDVVKPVAVVSASMILCGVFTREFRETDQQFSLAVFDTLYNTVNEKSGVISFTEKETEPDEAVLSDDGKLYMLMKVRETQNNTGDKRKTMCYHLFALSSDKSRMPDYRVNDLTRYTANATIAIDKLNNKVVVAGFYADKSSYAGAGLLFARLSLTDSTEWNIQHNPLKGDVQSKLVGERNNNSGLSLYSYPIAKMILRSDGGAVIITEAAYLSEYSYYDYFTQSYNRRIEYHYDNVVILSVNGDGHTDWSQVLHKDQTSLDDEGVYSSVGVMLTPDEIRLIYNADIGRNNSVAEFVADSQGHSLEKRISSPNDNMAVFPRFGKQVAEDMIILPCITKKRLFLLKISDE